MAATKEAREKTWAQEWPRRSVMSPLTRSGLKPQGKNLTTKKKVRKGAVRKV